MIGEDEYLERIVAGIHSVSSGEADVRWNEKINGRQFDVVVRFKIGTLDYLVLVEVKNKTRRASASDIEAFVTKARDQNASKAVFVTIAGFQTGAVAVAQRHGVDLFTIAFDQDISSLSTMATRIAVANPNYVGSRIPELNVSEPILTDVIEGAKLTYADGTSYEVPSEASQMNYYAEKTVLGNGSTLGMLMQSAPRYPTIEGKSRTAVVNVSPLELITPPDEYFYPKGMLASVDLTIVSRMNRIISGNIGIEPTSFSHPIKYKNVINGEETYYYINQLPLNTDIIEVGAFYMQINPLRYYKCESIKEQEISWILIESFQNCQLIQGAFTQDEKYGAYYIPVTDKITVRRLQGRSVDYLRRVTSRSAPEAMTGINRHARRVEKSRRRRRT